MEDAFKSLLQWIKDIVWRLRVLFKITYSNEDEILQSYPKGYLDPVPYANSKHINIAKWLSRPTTNSIESGPSKWKSFILIKSNPCPPYEGGEYYANLPTIRVLCSTNSSIQYAFKP